ncbi:hypothetical protein MTO96_005462 [Rhipicephalus appendiculatus]
MRLQEKESLDKHSEDRSAMCPPAEVQRYIDTGDREGEERYPGVERPFNAILDCSSRNHDSVPWYDFMNCCGCGIAGNLWSADRAPREQRRNSNAFATRDAQEECVLRGDFTPRFGTGRPFGRRICFPLHGPDSRPPKAFEMGEARGCSRSVLRSPRRSCKGAHGPPLLASRFRRYGCGALDRRSQGPRCAGVQLVPPTSAGVARRYCRTVGATRASIGAWVASALTRRTGREGRRRRRRRRNEGSVSGILAVRDAAAPTTLRR